MVSSGPNAAQLLEGGSPDDMRVPLANTSVCVHCIAYHGTRHSLHRQAVVHLLTACMAIMLSTRERHSPGACKGAPVQYRCRLATSTAAVYEC